MITILDNLHTDRERKDAIMKMIDQHTDPISQLRQLNKSKKYRRLLKEIRNDIRSGKAGIKGLISRNPLTMMKKELVENMPLLIADLILLLIIIINSI